uniref:Tyrosine decarboxylase n=1 Tax=Cryptocotyle lingua TaxID=66766 RepID=A0A7U0TI49_9TREM|nr:tyrosine decarboxylase [Cryptocotyle lingua]
MDDSSERKQCTMDNKQLNVWGKYMIDFICEYLDNIEHQRVIPTVEPGYLRPLLPEEAPEEAEQWPEILNDVKRFIIPGLTHWQHPRFHAYFPAANSTPSILGDMLSAAFGCIGFSWAASPAITELEIVMLDWVGKLLKLPQQFLHEGNQGGGVIQSSASDCILLSMLSARHQAVMRYRHLFADESNPETAVLGRLVAYASTLAHSCVEKAGMISFVQFRQIEPDQDFTMQGSALQEVIEEDRKRGLIPFFVCATIGSTSCCSFDNLASIGPVCQQNDLWLHVDGSYAGNACICPEFRHHLDGIEYAWSFNINPNKWLLVGFDCSLMWVRDTRALTESMVVDPVYLQHKHSRKSVDFRHWGIPLSRRFRALKLWFVLRTYGAKGLREYIRNHVRLAQLFAEKVREDNRFEIVGKPAMGLVCFRLKGSNLVNQYLTRAINESFELHVIPSVVGDVYFIRFAMCYENATIEHVENAWAGIQLIANEILAAKESLDKWHMCMARSNDKLMRSFDRSIDELYPSEESDNIGDHTRETAILCDLEDKLTKLARYRLTKLQQKGETEAYHLLLDYLESLGWEADRVVKDSESSGSRKLSSIEGKVTEDLEQRSQEASPLHYKTSASDSSKDSPFGQRAAKSLATKLQLEHGMPELNKLKLWLEFPFFSQEEGQDRDTFLPNASTSSPIQSRPRPPDHRDTISSAPLNEPRSGDAAPSDDIMPLVNDDHYDQPHISERDLAVGLIHTDTLTKLRRHTLIRMLADPTATERAAPGEPMLEHSSDRDSGPTVPYWKQKVRQFNKMLTSIEPMNRFWAGDTGGRYSSDSSTREDAVKRRVVPQLFRVHQPKLEEEDESGSETSTRNGTLNGIDDTLE